MYRFVSVALLILCMAGCASKQAPTVYGATIRTQGEAPHNLLVVQENVEYLVWGKVVFVVQDNKVTYTNQTLDHLYYYLGRDKNALKYLAAKQEFTLDKKSGGNMVEFLDRDGSRIGSVRTSQWSESFVRSFFSE